MVAGKQLEGKEARRSYSYQWEKIVTTAAVNILPNVKGVVASKIAVSLIFNLLFAMNIDIFQLGTDVYKEYFSCNRKYNIAV